MGRRRAKAAKRRKGSGGSHALTELSSINGGGGMTPSHHHHSIPFGLSSLYSNSSPIGGGTATGSSSISGGDLSDESIATNQLQQQQQQQQPDSEVDMDLEGCPVCGDKVSGYHYGLLTCESCKGFFKRTVQNKKVYTCNGERGCHIDKSSRKRCPCCRYEKCMRVGMKLEAVREDRMRGGRNKFGPMYKRDRARKQQQQRVRHVSPHQSYQSRYYKNSNGCKTENAGSSSMYMSPPPSSLYEPAFLKTEMIQIPHLSSTNSPESLQMSGGESSSSTVKSWSNSSYSHSPPLQYNQNGMIVDLMSGIPPPISYSQENLNEPGLQPFPGTVEELRATLVDEGFWQQRLFELLKSQTYNQCSVDLFELLTKVLDQCLFSQVEWARNSAFFKDLKLEDQMTLLQHSWSDLLMLDFIHHRLNNGLQSTFKLPNGQFFHLWDLALLGNNSSMDHLQRLLARFQDLDMDRDDYICLKFILLLDHATPGLNDQLHVLTGQNRVQSILLSHCRAKCPGMPDRYSQLILQLPDLRLLANQCEESLYHKHMTASAISDTSLLMELLLSKRKSLLELSTE